MITSFKNRATEDIFYGRNTKAARKLLPQNLWNIASRKLDQVDSVDVLEDFKIPLGNKLEPLSGDRKGEHSIRINKKYRICFQWLNGTPEQVEITDYH